MSKIYPLKGQLMNYAWGGNSFISNLLSITQDNQPIAEYWLGAHAHAPSIIKTSNGTFSLNEYIRKAPLDILGKKVNAQFGRLPFLLKVLDVSNMLSIQVHPSKAEAEKGFACENALNIPLDASHRNYKDDNYKPEIMVALSEFWLIHGFLPQDKLMMTLQNIPSFRPFIAQFEVGGYKGLYKYVMELSTSESDQVLQPLIDIILPKYHIKKLDKSSPDYWVAKAVDQSGATSGYDKGIFSIYFFNLLQLKEGEGIFQGAGIPHTYLEGQNIELMANSDNVLRGGLTPKHIDVSEFLKQVTFEATLPNILLGKLQRGQLERVYKSSVPDFDLSRVSLRPNDNYKTKSKSAEIILVMNGEIMIKETKTILTLKKGEAVFVKVGATFGISAVSHATFYKATIGIVSK